MNPDSAANTEESSEQRNTEWLDGVKSNAAALANDACASNPEAVMPITETVKDRCACSATVHHPKFIGCERVIRD